MSDRIVVAISGQVSAGKTTAGDHLAKLGFGYTRISWAIRHKLLEGGSGEPTRKTYQDEGLSLHQIAGQRWLCKRAVGLLPPFAFHFVVDGLRWNEDVCYFRERYGRSLIHLHVVADEGLRRLRYESRDKDIPFDDVEGHAVEQEVSRLAPIADAIIENNSDMASYLASVQRALELELYAR